MNSCLTAQTVLLDFSIPLERELDDSKHVIENFFNQHLRTVSGESSCLKLECKVSGNITNTSCYTDKEDLLITIREATIQIKFLIFLRRGLTRTCVPSRLVTVNIEAPRICPSALWRSQSHLYQFIQQLHTELGSVSDKVNILPAITRGLHTSPYWTTTDDRIVECGIKSVVHEEVSPYQKIQILDTVDFGRLLLLDGQVQLSEADDVYSTELMAGGDYQGADILILGGGDGALLARLLPHKPKHVTMVELDGAVMRVVREHMESVTRGVLDKHTADNYNIITGDAIHHLADCLKEDKQYDFIFGDLTDVPIDTDHTTAELWDFLSTILSLALSCITPGGSYLTHVTGKASHATLATFRQTVTTVSNNIGRDVNINFSEAFVPSFMEKWVFAEISVKV